ncbi:ImuA family protein [Pseudidiomarina sp. E22-M8]|uniref:ImuA family protein n=1 Tax=Pseudidiomarina sp. E22-M8 TaxID=3424768 RepID=UPI00403D3E7B
MAHPLQDLVHKGWVWQGHDAGKQLASDQLVDTGWPELNRRLGGGWLRGALHELQVQHNFQGEQAFLMPVLSAQQKPCLWINPPAQPYWPGLHYQQLQQAPLWLQESDPKRALWAFEQALQSASLGVIVAWLPTVDASAVRRLQQAASRHQQLAFILTPWQQQQEARAYVNRLQLQWQQQQLQVAVVKRRAGWPLPPFPCPVTRHLPEWRRRLA